VSKKSLFQRSKACTLIWILIVLVFMQAQSNTTPDRHRKSVPAVTRFLIVMGCGLLSCLLCMPTRALGTRSEPEDAFLNLKTRIEAHYFSHAERAVQALRQQAETLSGRYPEAWYPRHYAALVYIQLGNIARAGNRQLAYRYYQRAREHAHAAHERAPNAENTLVLADVYGKLASLKTFKMLYYGSRSKTYLKAAFNLNPRSPKNHLIAGIEIMWTPGFFGGSKKRARAFLDKALVLASSWRETDPLIVRWATRPEIFAHLAQLEILCDDPVRARGYVSRALELRPDYDFVHRDIIPQLRQPGGDAADR
jgi:tetratricopeptide (TPR) repeat protein